MKIESGKGESADSNQIRNWHNITEIPFGYGYQRQFVPGMRPGGAQLQNFIVRQGQRRCARRAPLQQQHRPRRLFHQQMIPRWSRRMRYPPVRNVPEGSLPGIAVGMLAFFYMRGVPGISQGLPIGTLSSAVANASPEQKRTMLGEFLYPLVDQLEHEHAPKVTGMLLEMGQTEVLHLLESPEALKSKVAEAMEVLNNYCQMLGESLYPLVEKLEHGHAATVTGMLLEMYRTEVLYLLESPSALKCKVAEAMEVLRLCSQMLGEILYPLVDQLEHDHAPKVTGMLLEMDQTEVLHLLESPEALKSKVAEAMEVLRNVSQQPTGPLRSLQRYP